MHIFSREYWNLDKPVAATSQEWRTWQERMQQEKLLPYVIQEQIPHMWHTAWRRAWKPSHALIWWVRHRTTNRMHVLRSGLAPGYHDKPELMLHVNMQMLMDFVEIECAQMATICMDEWQHARKGCIKRWLRIDVRNAEAGVAYLEAPLDGEGTDNQRAVQSEIVSLYRWWTQVRPDRPDPYEASGWDAFCVRNANILNLDGSHDAEAAQILARLRDMETAHEQEDQLMLRRLIDVRPHLWC